MGSKQSLPPDRTEFISMNSFYQGDNDSSPKNIYESRWSATSSKQIIHKTISFTESTETITRYLAMLENLGKKVQCNNLYLPIVCKVIQSESVCTEYKTLELYYEDYDVKIKEEIMARKKYHERFAEEEVWYLLYSMLNAAKMFEKVGMATGNLTTESLRLNEKGHLKLINILTWPESISATKKFNRFYSPEELRAMRERIQKRINPNISETYSIAIIVLEMCTFIDGESFYNQNSLMLNESTLERAEEIVSKNYSKLLYNLLRTMLSGHYDRPLPSQIYAVFQPYEQEILRLRPFQFQLQKNQTSLSNASLMSL